MSMQLMAGDIFERTHGCLRSTVPRGGWFLLKSSCHISVWLLLLLLLLFSILVIFSPRALVQSISDNRFPPTYERAETSPSRRDGYIICLYYVCMYTFDATEIYSTLAAIIQIYMTYTFYIIL